jgi:hypothetical protein
MGDFMLQQFLNETQKLLQARFPLAATLLLRVTALLFVSHSFTKNLKQSGVKGSGFNVYAVLHHPTHLSGVFAYCYVCTHR